jgi:hypothetical protein
MLAALPPTFEETREALHALACYVVAPARKARTGRIALRPTAGGFGTPPFADGTTVSIDGRGIVAGGRGAPITTLRAAAAHVGIVLSRTPGVGSDLPPFEPDAELRVDAPATAALAHWYRFGSLLLAGVAAEEPSTTEAQLWPEHFDLAVVVHQGTARAANVGFSPGDRHNASPYVYVGPVSGSVRPHGYWNAPFGALMTYDELAVATSPAQAAREFIDAGLDLLRAV